MENEKNLGRAQTDGSRDDEMEELDRSFLKGVSGTGNPFDIIPRVPTQEIDEDLRDNG